MWACFPFCSIFRRPRLSDEPSTVISSSPPSLNKSAVEENGWYVLGQFSNEVNRKAVQFAPPVPALARCSMCGLVPPRLYRSESCQHTFCSVCVVQAQPNCPFDCSSWSHTSTDAAALELVSRASVFCWNRIEGCNYVGCLLDMPSHYRLCPYYRTRCGLCGQGVRMKDLSLHASILCTFSNGVEMTPTTTSSNDQCIDKPSSSETRSLTRTSGTRKVDFMWMIKPYTKIKEGVHHFRSEPFLCGTGHTVQLFGSIKSTNAVEVKAAVHFLPRYAGQTTALPNSVPMASFRLLKNNEQKSSRGKTNWVGKVYFCFKNEISADAWQPVAKLRKSLFEKEFVSNDAFVLKFTTDACASGV